VRLLLTRPQADAERTAAALRERGHEAIIAPLFRIEFDPDATLGAGPWAAILVTSTNAARALQAHSGARQLTALPVFAVGDRSAETMRAAGFANVTSADRDVSELGALVVGRLTPGARLLYLAAEDRAGDLAGELRASGFAVETVVTYRAAAVATLPRPAADAIREGIGGVLHFSRRSAKTYVEAARRAGLLEAAMKPVQFCLSAPIAAPLTHAGAGDIRVAARPDEAALLDLIA
jgi:uroporphyrinogen-III synthase